MLIEEIKNVFPNDEFMLCIAKWQEELNLNYPTDAVIYNTLEDVLDCYICFCKEN